ncbi:MAG: hypothetical protein OEY33_04885 [Bdellovibrionales bacterium]|nr:hypothetical protein [Bdellovibrionales bacterium]
MGIDHTLKFREQFRQKIPKLYSGVFHLLFNFSLLLLTFIFPLTQIKNFKPIELWVIPVVLILGNAVVFFIHKYPLHRQSKLFKFAYTIHSKYHHVFFTDKVLVFETTKDFYILFFPTWVVLGFVLTYFPLLYFGGPYLFSLNIIYLAMSMGSLYFLLYEILHFCSHLPESHPILRVPGVRYMWNHHKTHHDPKLMGSYNFNIVYPLMDILMGTKYKKD